MVAIFARSTTDKLASLVKQLDELVEKDWEKKDADEEFIGLRGFVVLISIDRDSAQEQLESMAHKQGIKSIPLAIYDAPDGGPHPYRIAKDADVTVILHKGAVVNNHAFREGMLNQMGITAVIRDAIRLSE